MKAWVLFACVVSLWLSQSAPKTPIFDSPEVRDWLTAAAEHQPGVEDAALQRIAGWSGSKLLRTLGNVREERSTDELNALLERAAVLHGDVMLLREEANPHWKDAPEFAGSSVLAKDGQRIGSRSLDPHLFFARKVFMAMRPPRPSHGQSRSVARSLEEAWTEAHRRNPRIHQWYRAVSTELAARHWLADLRPHLADAHRVLDANAATMFDTACFGETMASAQIQRAVAPRPSPSKMNTIPLRAEFDGLLFDEGANLSDAERYYRDALKLDPGYAEARVRLARVLSLKNRHADALALLGAPVESDDPVVRYYGFLALGQAAEGAQKPDVAREAYERASQLFSRAQSPLIAQMRLARDRGDDRAAAAIAATFASLGPDEHARADPWWRYFDCHGRNRERELEALWVLYRTTEAR